MSAATEAPMCDIGPSPCCLCDQRGHTERNCPTAVNRDLHVNAALTLAEIAEQHFDPTLRVICSISAYGLISLQLYDGGVADAARLADALGLTEASVRPIDPGDEYIHHHWYGKFGGFTVEVLKLVSTGDAQ